MIEPTLENPLLTINRVALIFGVKPNTVRKWILDKKIDATKVNNHWMIEQEEINRIANKWHGDNEQGDK